MRTKNKRILFHAEANTNENGQKRTKNEYCVTLRNQQAIQNKFWTLPIRKQTKK